MLNMEAKDLHSSDGSKRCVDLLPMTAVGLLLMPLTLKDLFVSSFLLEPRHESLRQTSEEQSGLLW